MREENTVSKCPECGHILYFDYNTLSWRCTNPRCEKVYKYEELHEVSVAERNKTRHSTSRPHLEARSDNYEPCQPDVHSGFKPSHGLSYGHSANREPSEKSHRVPIIIGITLACIVAVIMFIILIDPFTPTLSANPPSFYFTVYDGLNPPSQTLNTESSGRTITWSAIDDARWLNVDPIDGTTDDETLITLSVDLTGMHPGEYTGTITIYASKAKNELIEIPACLVIKETEETLAIKKAVSGSAGNLEIYYDEQPPYSKGPAYTHISLTNNELATDPTWQQLLQFIASDDTDEEAYVEGIYMCGSFADTLHNNAEKEGIRAAWVGVNVADDIIGHALNAFNTIDQGIVFVDCTGGGFDVLVPSLGDTQIYERDYDKIAYVKIGGEYGAVAVEVAESPQYTFYERYEKRWERYKTRVEEYNTRAEEYGARVEEYGARVEEYIEKVSSGKYDYATMQMMYLDLEREGEELGRETEYLKGEAEYLNQLIQDLGYYRLESLGVVSHVEVYW